MTKLIESQTAQILPSGVTMTTLHLSPEGRRGLSTGGAQIPILHVLRIADLPVARVQQRPREIRHALRSPALGCVISAIVLQLLGAPAFVILVCQVLVVIALWRFQKKRLLSAKALKPALQSVAICKMCGAIDSSRPSKRPAFALHLPGTME